MRTIKFRLIRDNKIVGYEEHRYIENLLGKKGSSVYIYHSHTGHGLSWKCVSMGEKNYIKHNDKNQYTGLRDGSNSPQEICEGDIVKYYDSTTMWLTGEVKEVGAVFAIITTENPIGLYDFVNQYKYDGHSIDEIRVIGNIYENKDLLNENSKTD